MGERVEDRAALCPCGEKSSLKVEETNKMVGRTTLYPKQVSADVAGDREA